MKFLFQLATALPLWALVSPDPSGPRPGFAADVAVAPFTIDRDSAGVLRAVADTCFERLVRGLKAKGVAVAHYSKLSEKSLRVARPVHWAVLGHLSHEQGQFRAELRLLDVESGDEMRSYLNAGKDPEAIGNLGAAAADRIALFVQERKGAH